MQNDISTEFSDVYFFYEYLIYHLFNFAKRVEWKKIEPNLQEDFLKLIAYFDRKVVGEGRVRTVYKADVIKDSDDIIYYVEQQKKVFIKRLNKPRKEKPEPLMLPRSETGLPVDISDVEAWSTAEWGQMEYIVLSKGDETYCIFPENKDQQTDEKHEMERIWNFLGDDYEDTCFTKEEIEAVREWMNVQLKDENSTLSRYFAQRRAEDEKHHKDLVSRIQENTARQKENLCEENDRLFSDLEHDKAQVIITTENRADERFYAREFFEEHLKVFLPKSHEQDDITDLRDIINHSTLPAFVTNFTEKTRHLPGLEKSSRVAIPIRDEAVNVHFYAVCRVEMMKQMESVLRE